MTAFARDLPKGRDAPYAADDKMPVMLTFMPNWPLRTLVFQVTGTALILGALAIWVLPGTEVVPELLLFKLGVSVFFLFCGLALVMLHQVDNRPEAHFDPIRTEVRVLQKNKRGRPQTVLRRRYDSLGSVSFSKAAVELYDVDGSLLIRLQINDPDIRQSLRMQLSGLVRMAS